MYEKLIGVLKKNPAYDGDCVFIKEHDLRERPDKVERLMDGIRLTKKMLEVLRSDLRI